MEELRNEGIMETVETVVEEATETIATGGRSKVGGVVAIIGGIGMLAAGAYFGIKRFRNKKAKSQEVAASENVEVFESDFVESEEIK